MTRTLKQNEIPDHNVFVLINYVISDFEKQLRNSLLKFEPTLEVLSDKGDQTDSRLEKTEPLNSSGSSSDSEDDLGTSASVQEEKREFEAGLSDLRHKLAQEVIIEEEEGKFYFRWLKISVIHIRGPTGPNGEFQNFVGPGPVQSEIWKFFLVLVRFSPWF